MIAYFGFLTLVANTLYKSSIAQDLDGASRHTFTMRKFGIIGIVVVGLSITFTGFDWLMGLDYHWFSTMWGVYIFAGAAGSSMSLIVLLTTALKSKGYLKAVNQEHYHIMGKFMLAFCIFWAYIGFSQYMLIWYANLPEETTYIIPRTEGAWLPVSLLLLIGKFIVPFIALLPRWAKRSPVHLTALAIWILIMQYVDLYWLVYPAFSPEHVKFGFFEITIFAGFLGLFLMVVTRFLSRHSIVPLKDPRIEESLHHHVTY